MFAGLEATINRTTKPFNPLLGETWEHDDGELKIITEQVSHHPPISAGKYDNQRLFSSYF